MQNVGFSHDTAHFVCDLSFYFSPHYMNMFYTMQHRTCFMLCITERVLCFASQDMFYAMHDHVHEIVQH